MYLVIRAVHSERAYPTKPQLRWRTACLTHPTFLLDNPLEKIRTTCPNVSEPIQLYPWFVFSFRGPIWAQHLVNANTRTHVGREGMFRRRALRRRAASRQHFINLTSHKGSSPTSTTLNTSSTTVEPHFTFKIRSKPERSKCARDAPSIEPHFDLVLRVKCCSIEVCMGCTLRPFRF